jgi:hypothetical protein
MRNAVAHGKMDIHGEDPLYKNAPAKIEHICFDNNGKDRSIGANVSFRIDLKIHLLKDFVLEFIKKVIGDSVK